MKGASRVFGAVLCTAVLASFASAVASSEPSPEARNIAGSYLSTGDATKSVRLEAIDSDAYRVLGNDWQGVGLLDGTTYLGVFRRDLEPGPHRYGTHRGTLRPDGSLAVHGEFVDGQGKAFDVIWAPDRKGAPPRQSALPVPTFEQPVWPPRNQAPNPDGLPAPGDYVQIDELPEALTKVAPDYPSAAREARQQGTVLVQALVGKEGRVLDTKIVKSVDGLDEAAMRAVRQWVFKPAMAGGKPVAVWVAVPVNFSLH